MADAVTCYAAIIGTDFNDGGLQSYGHKKSQEVTSWLRKAWRQQNSSLSFEGFVEGVLLGEIDIDTSKKVFQTFLQYARHEAKVEYTAEPFTEQLRAVFRIVRDQRQQAEREAARVTREQLLWDGGRLQHAKFVSLLEENQTVKVGSKDKNPPVLRLMNLEAERMLRSCEGSCTACSRVSGVAKVKEFGKEDQENAVRFCPAR